MTWTPVNPGHAIERVRFITKFRENIPSKLLRQMGEKVASQRHETRLDGPITLNGFNLAFQVTPDGQPVLAEPSAPQSGWQFSRNSVAGAVIEMIAVAGDQVIYETIDYRRWTTFKQRFEKVVSSALNMAASTLDVDIVSLEYFDRFVFSGNSAEARPDLLLVGVHENLHDAAKSGNKLWHVHRGWYEPADGGDVLVNQNFDASEIPAKDNSEEKVRSISILTKIDLRAAMYAIGDEPIVGKLDFMHKLSKDYFQRSVRSELLRSVGILDGK